MVQYSNLGTQLGAKNKDFGPVSQTDLTRSLISSALWHSLSSGENGGKFHTLYEEEIAVLQILPKNIPEE